MSSGGSYDPRAVEPQIYELWEQGRHFRAVADSQRKPYTIVIPPPNVTGALHLGHALNNTLQDILVRAHRMRGYVACWLPGTDHAGIATQAVVEKRVREQEGKTRHELGREGLVAKIWQWKEEYNARILGQLRSMGCSCDWDRTRFTLDEGCVAAVYETFFRMFRDGLIYRGERLVNWDCELQTAVADDEVYHETVKGHLWHIRYPILPGDPGTRAGAEAAGTGSAGVSAATVAEAIARATGPEAQVGRDYLVVATTRPETMLGDTAVAVHPDDERYRHLIGQHVLLPLMERPIPVIGDGLLVRREFGSGCVKVTPAHDPNDYACGQRHGLPMINVLTPDGRINERGGAFAGLHRQKARAQVVARLEELGLLEKIEPYETDVGHSDRSKSPIEPMLSEQWFVKMDRLAETAMEAVRDGRVQFYPERFARSYLDWLGEKRDWCISRQLWWGHRIPVWTRRMSWNESLRLAGNERDEFVRGFFFGSAAQNDVCVRVVRDDGYAYTIAGCEDDYEQAVRLRDYTDADERMWWFVCLRSEAFDTGVTGAPPMGQWLEEHGFERDPDVLDTWFSSALWPHSTFGWPGAAVRRAGGATDERGSDQAGGRGSDQTGNRGADLEYFYPTNVLVTNRDIISLWVARMVMTGLYNMGRVPFQHVCIHPTIQDGQGRRMSKSLGNGVDPLDLISMYGADAMRFTLASLASETQDCRIPVKPLKLDDGRTINTSERFELGRNFCNKLWQASLGFVVPQVQDVRIERRAGGHHTSRPPAELPLFDRWIRTRLQHCIRQVDRNLAAYRFAAAADELRTFFWSELCDWYIEEAKVRLREADADAANDTKIVLLQVLDVTLALLHPFVPFITEKIWQEISAAVPRHHELVWPEKQFLTAELAAKWGEKVPAKAPPLIKAPWPTAWAEALDAETEREVGDLLMPLIRGLREIRTHVNAMRSASKQSALRTLPRAVVRTDAGRAESLEKHRSVLLRLGQCDQIEIGPDAVKPPESASKIFTGLELYVPLTGLADLEVERKRLGRERDDLAGHIERLAAKLANEGFVAKAPPAVVESERARLEELRGKLAAIEANLAEIGG